MTDSLKEPLIEELKDLLCAEGQLIAQLSKMATFAYEPKLKQAFKKHLEDTEGHVECLKQAFEALGAKAAAAQKQKQMPYSPTSQECYKLLHDTRSALTQSIALSQAILPKE